MPLSSGDKFGPYEIVSPLGSGGMGEVYRSRDTRLGRDVALKILPTDLTNDPSRRARFEQEARAAAALQHPGIVAVFDVGQQDGTAYMVTELIDGSTLRELLSHGPLVVRKAIDIAAQMAEALAAAHAAGISHRDLKPENVMVTREGRAKILDFGLAKLAPQSGSDITMTAVGTTPGAVMGTVGYMSPEQARGLPADHRADIFSLGVVFSELLTGKRAFQRDSAIETLNAIIKEDPAPLSADLPPGLGPIINHCLEKEPMARFQSAKDLAFALRSAAGTSVSSGISAAITAAPRRIPWLWLALPLALALGAFLSWWWTSSRDATNFYHIRPLTAFEGFEGNPALSPNGQQLAFNRGGGLDANGIFVKLVDGAGQTLRLTQDGSFPTWSPDGTQIYFRRGTRGQAGNLSLWAMSAIGGGERRITEFSREQNIAAGLAITPDGRWLIAMGRGNSNGLLQVPVEGGAFRVLTSPSPGQRDSAPAFTPDGRKLAFTRTAAQGTRQLLLLDLAADYRPNGEPRILDSGNWDIRGLAWMPDGRWLLAATLDGARERIVKFPVGGGKPTRLPLEWLRDDQSDLGIREISLAGSRLALTLPVGHFAITKWTALNPNGEFSIEPFESSSRSDQYPDLSPDGKWVSFASTRSGAAEIWRALADGSEALQLTSFGGIVAEFPKISPDGRSIAFFVIQQGLSELWVVGSEGGRPQLLQRNVGNEERPAWSPDSKTIFATDRSAAKSAIVRISRDGAPPKIFVPERATSPALSADGKWLYFRNVQRGPASWSRIPLGGGEAIPLGEYSDQAVLGGNKLYFQRTDSEAKLFQVFEVDPETKKERLVFRQPLQDQPPILSTVSPDGKTFFFNSTRNSGADILLVDGIR